MMLALLMLVAAALAAALVAIQMSHVKIGNITLFDDDMHYQLVSIGTLTESAANTFTTSLINRPEDMNSNMTTQNNGLGVEMVVNAFGKGRHGLSVWDVKEFLIGFTEYVDVDGDDNQVQWALTSGDVPLIVHVPSAGGGNDFVVGDRVTAESATITAVGEINAQDRLISNSRWQMPMEIIEGNSSHLLMTAENYHLAIKGIGEGAAKVLFAAFYGRRVLIELNEVFFDRGDVKELLNAVLLAGLLD